MERTLNRPIIPFTQNTIAQSPTKNTIAQLSINNAIAQSPTKKHDRPTNHLQKNTINQPTTLKHDQPTNHLKTRSPNFPSQKRDRPITSPKSNKYQPASF